MAVRAPPEVIAILRGGGSRDDLAVFDDEKLVRAVAASRIPTIAGIGHEIDTTLVDLAVDKRASTPSNAAELLVPDRRELLAQTDDKLSQMVHSLERQVIRQRGDLDELLTRLDQNLYELMIRALFCGEVTLWSGASRTTLFNVRWLASN